MSAAEPWENSGAHRRGGAAHGREPRKQQSGFLAMLREIGIIVVSALILSWLIKTLLVQPFYIPSASMEDTLTEGDRVMASRLTPGPFDLEHGDIVVFVDPGDWLPPYPAPDRGPVGNAAVSFLTTVGLLPQDTGDHLIKRLVGLPGDTVVCCDAEGRVSVNGAAIDETYIKPGSEPSQDPFEVTVPDGMLWVMGDNRQNSQDSRYNRGKPGGGFVPVDNVVGTAFATVWPLDRLDWHSTPSHVFAGVPDAPPAEQ
ncbi:signal peptidase I [Promicromonospora iranensis]|uniref:Signal peptidase I n=1 Tax=Promicromonospora iranensis TaxID=1105144 RepID=A0ABU2CJM7_9MICO|nr:signal peptidase I [Promicromonospora iranensis]MDR7381544.1 signal peptidase I [Promicromonospora iranensis]